MTIRCHRIDLVAQLLARMISLPKPMANLPYGTETTNTRLRGKETMPAHLLWSMIMVAPLPETGTMPTPFLRNATTAACLLGVVIPIMIPQNC